MQLWVRAGSKTLPIAAPVAGVAIGLVTRCDSETDKITDHKLLTNILVKCYFFDFGDVKRHL